MAEQEDFDNILKQHRGGDPVDTAEEEYKGVVKKQRIKASNDKYVHGKLRKEKQKVRNRQRKLEEEEKNRGEDEEDIPVLEGEVVEEEERKSGGSSTNDTTSKSSSKSKGKSKDKSTGEDEDEDEVERPSIPYHKIIPGLTSLGTNGPHSRVVTAIVLMIVILGLFLTIVPITVVGIGRTTRGNLAAMAVGGGVTIS